MTTLEAFYIGLITIGFVILFVSVFPLQSNVQTALRWVGWITVLVSFIAFGIVNSGAEATAKREADWKVRVDAARLLPENQPTLIEHVGDCEVWDFFLGGSKGHIMIKCPNSTATITTRTGKMSTETISTESK